MTQIEQQYYIVSNNIGISLFDLMSNDSMSSMGATKDKFKWVRFLYEDALIAKKTTGWDMLEADPI